jgi:hypothetical protein
MARSASARDSTPFTLAFEVSMAGARARSAARARLQVDVELGAGRRKPGGRGLEAHTGGTRDTVQRAVDEGHLGRTAHIARHGAAPAAPVAAHLEQVGEVGGELQREMHAASLLGVAGHGEKLVAARLPQVLGARHVVGVLGEHQAIALEDVRGGEVDIQGEVVGLHGRRQAQRAVALEREVQARQVARVEVEQSGRAVLGFHHVAELVEHREAVVVLQRAPARRRQRYHARNEHRPGGDFGLGLVLHTAFNA